MADQEVMVQKYLNLRKSLVKGIYPGDIIYPIFQTHMQKLFGNVTISCSAFNSKRFLLCETQILDLITVRSLLNQISYMHNMITYFRAHTYNQLHSLHLY